jgi:hypothetical protein
VACHLRTGHLWTRSFKIKSHSKDFYGNNDNASLSVNKVRPQKSDPQMSGVGSANQMLNPQIFARRSSTARTNIFSIYHQFEITQTTKITKKTKLDG